MALLAAAASCHRAAPTDADLYTQALSEGLAGAQTCSRIVDAEVQGDCASWIARKAAEQGRDDLAVAACEGLEDGMWRDECFFQLADGLQAQGAWGKRLCDDAGRYHARCMDHVARRTLGQLLRDLPRGRELEHQVEAVAAAADLVGPKRAKRFSQKAIVAAIAARPDDPFAMATCGTVSASVCMLAYRRRVQDFTSSSKSRGPNKPLGVLLRAVCPGPVTVAAATAAGFPAWDPDAQPIAEEAWQQLCLEVEADRQTPARGGSASP